MKSATCDWLSIAQGALALHEFAARHYVMQPPLFSGPAATLASAVAAESRTFSHRARMEPEKLYFGFQGLMLADSLLLALKLARETGSQIEVGGKANPRYDLLYGSLGAGVDEDTLDDLVAGAIAFHPLEAYATVYANRPTRLLQPVFRSRMGYRTVVTPSRADHERFVDALRGFSAGGSGGRGLS